MWFFPNSPSGCLASGIFPGIYIRTQARFFAEFEVLGRAHLYPSFRHVVPNQASPNSVVSSRLKRNSTSRIKWGARHCCTSGRQAHKDESEQEVKSSCMQFPCFENWKTETILKMIHQWNILLFFDSVMELDARNEELKVEVVKVRKARVQFSPTSWDQSSHLTKRARRR